jgi:cell wall assembly regulator SMI1
MGDGRPETASEAWRRVVAWCAEQAPRTAAALHGPAHEAALITVQQELGQVWPDDLLAWLRVSDGADGSPAASIIPWGFVPMPIDRIGTNWRMMTDISREVGDAEDLAAMEGEPAGSRASHFLSAWVPVAGDGCGDMLFVDLRPGELYGCVGRFWEDGFHGPEYGVHFWTSVGQMAQTLAEALEAGRWAPDDTGEQDKVPVVTDGVLEWEDPDDWETLSWTPDPDGVQPSSSDDLAAKVFMLYAQDYSDAEIAERLGISVEQAAQLREGFRRSH